MEKGIEIEVLGHKTKIDFVSARQADGIWYKEDFLMVSLTFDEAVDGLLGFAVNLPVKRYEKDEFLAKVKAAAEVKLPKILEKHRQEREMHKREKERQEGLFVRRILVRMIGNRHGNTHDTAVAGLDN